MPCSQQINHFLTAIFQNILSVGEGCVHSALTDRRVTITEIHILDQIGPEGSRRMGDVAESLGVTLPTLTASAERLCRKGLAVKARDGVDRRVVNISLTDAGREVCRLHSEFHQRLVARVTQGLEPSDLPAFTRLLEQVNGFFEELSAEGGALLS